MVVSTHFKKICSTNICQIGSFPEIWVHIFRKKTTLIYVNWIDITPWKRRKRCIHCIPPSKSRTYTKALLMHVYHFSIRLKIRNHLNHFESHQEEHKDGYWRMTQGFIFGNGTPSLKLTAKAPENEWFEYFLVSFGGKTPIFRCYVSFKECISYAKGSPFKFLVVLSSLSSMIQPDPWGEMSHLRFAKDLLGDVDFCQHSWKQPNKHHPLMGEGKLFTRHHSPVSPVSPFNTNLAEGILDSWCPKTPRILI